MFRLFSHFCVVFMCRLWCLTVLHDQRKFTKASIIWARHKNSWVSCRTSLKAVQSLNRMEKGPGSCWQQLLFLLPRKNKKEQQHLSAEMSTVNRAKASCPTWEFQLGHLCWFVNGTICQGKVQKIGTGRWSFVGNVTISNPFDSEDNYWIYIAWIFYLYAIDT
jgi:hypothetical protein